jgi:hypothetical protein
MLGPIVTANAVSPQSRGLTGRDEKGGNGQRRAPPFGFSRLPRRIAATVLVTPSKTEEERGDAKTPVSRRITLPDVWDVSGASISWGRMRARGLPRSTDDIGRGTYGSVPCATLIRSSQAILNLG